MASDTIITAPIAEETMQELDTVRKEDTISPLKEESQQLLYQKRPCLWDKMAELKVPINPSAYSDLEHGFFVKVEALVPTHQASLGNLGQEASQSEIFHREDFHDTAPLLPTLFMGNRKPKRRNAFTLPPGIAYTRAWLSDLATEFSLHRNMSHQHLCVLSDRLIQSIEYEKYQIIKLEHLLQALQESKEKSRSNANTEDILSSNENGDEENTNEMELNDSVKVECPPPGDSMDTTEVNDDDKTMGNQDETHEEDSILDIDLLYEVLHSREEALESLRKFRESVMHIILSNRKLFKQLKIYRPKRQLRDFPRVSLKKGKAKRQSLFDELGHDGAALQKASRSSNVKKSKGSNSTNGTSVRGTGVSRRERDRDALKRLIAQESLSS